MMDIAERHNRKLHRNYSVIVSFSFLHNNAYLTLRREDLCSK